MNALVLSRITALTMTAQHLHARGRDDIAERAENDLRCVLTVVGYDPDKVLGDAARMVADVTLDQTVWLSGYREAAARLLAGDTTKPPSDTGGFSFLSDIHERIKQHESNLVGWQEPSGYLVPTEPDADERALVRIRLRAAIVTLRSLLGDADRDRTLEIKYENDDLRDRLRIADRAEAAALANCSGCNRP